MLHENTNEATMNNINIYKKKKKYIFFHIHIRSEFVPIFIARTYHIYNRIFYIFYIKFMPKNTSL